MSGIRSIVRTPTIKGYATANSAPFYVDSDDNRVKLIPTGTGTTEVILQEAGGASMYETLTAARVLTAADSGKTFSLNAAAGFTVTLPALSAGLVFNFVVGISPTGANYIITSPGAIDNIAGRVLPVDGNAGDTENDFTADLFNFVANQSVIGDTLEIRSVSLGWYGVAVVAVAAGGTFTG